MRVKYRCKVCKAEREVTVPERPQAVDLKLWLEGVERRIDIDHKLASPACPSQVIDLMIPVGPGDTRIGQGGAIIGDLPPFKKDEEDTLE
jgi:hypothetical protein